MRDFGSYYRDPFNLQQVEVLKGPASSEFGRGSTGGVVNQSSKAPSLQPFVGADLFLGTAQTFRATADIDQPLTALGDGAAFQLAVMGNDSHVAGRDVAQNRRFGVAPSFGFGLDGPTRVTLSYFHLTAKDIPDYGVPWYFNEPAPVDRANYYGFEDGSFLDTTADMGTIRFEHDFSPSVSIRNQARYARYSRDGRITEARIPTSVTPETPLDTIQVTRNQIAVNSAETFLQNQLDATFRFATGNLQHTVVTGIEFGRETSDPIRRAFSGVPGTSLLRPDPGQEFAGTSTVSSRVDTTSDTFAAYALDTVAIGKFDVTAGIRWDRFATDYVQSVAPVQDLSRDRRDAQLESGHRLQAHADGRDLLRRRDLLQPVGRGPVALGRQRRPRTRRRTAPTRSARSGTSLQGRLAVRVAAFRTEKLNAREPDPNNPALNVLSGKQRVDGAELEVSGRITERLARQPRVRLPERKARRVAVLPAMPSARAWPTCRRTRSGCGTSSRCPGPSSSAAGANYVGSRTASTTAPNDPVTGLLKEAPGYWTFDAMIRRPLSPSLELQLNLYNLGNTTYYDQLHPGHIVPGAGRAALLGVAMKM